jgi:hypothetical protein
MKPAFQLMAMYRKPFSKQNYGHQGSILGGHSCNARLVRISEVPAFNADLDYRYTGLSDLLLVAGGLALEPP